MITERTYTHCVCYLTKFLHLSTPRQKFSEIWSDVALEKHKARKPQSNSKMLRRKKRGDGAGENRGESGAKDVLRKKRAASTGSGPPPNSRFVFAGPIELLWLSVFKPIFGILQKFGAAVFLLMILPFFGKPRGSQLPKVPALAHSNLETWSSCRHSVCMCVWRWIVLADLLMSSAKAISSGQFVVARGRAYLLCRGLCSSTLV